MRFSTYIFSTLGIVLVFIASFFIYSSAKSAVLGCTNSFAYNYNASADTDDGSCYYFDVKSPLNGSLVTIWEPYLESWSGASICEYSYTGTTYSSSTCSLDGSDIPAPSSGSNTLYLRNDYIGTIVGTSTTFTYSPSSIWSAVTDLSYTTYYFSGISETGTRAYVITGASSYSTSDSGTSWTQGQGSLSNTAITDFTATPDHSLIIAAYRPAFHAPEATGGYLRKTTDYGASWSYILASGELWWSGVAVSDDGQKIFATADGSESGTGVPGHIRISTDGGTTWATSTSAGSKRWRGADTSSDGSVVAAITYNEYVYISLDSGTTWATSTALGTSTWASISISADGAEMALAPTTGYAWFSSDSGTTWATSSSLSIATNWKKISLSGDGTKVLAVSSSTVSYSNDFGVTWTDYTDFRVTPLRSGEISKDGNKAIVNATGYSYLATFPVASTPISGRGYLNSTGSGSASAADTALNNSWWINYAARNGLLTVVATSTVSDSIGTSTATTSTSSITDAITVYPSPIFIKDLKLGGADSEVRALQRYLNTHGYIVSNAGPGSLNNETTFFGVKTKEALKKFQAANKLPSTGFFGPMTKAVINR